MVRYSNKFILNSLKIPMMSDISELSNKMGITTKLLFNLSNYQEKYYRTFEIMKRSGGIRILHSPNKPMKLVQKWILEEILEKIYVSDQSMAYVKGDSRGIKENAEIHKYNNYFLELDIQDFFTSIKRKRVFWVFKSIGYNDLISNILANICTLDGSLPQGGVCSPYLSNVICTRLDERLFHLSSKRDVIYTRYADDMTFSCNNEKTIFIIENIVKNIINDEGFTVNNEKTRFLFPTSNKIVTGLLIYNKEVKVKKSYKRKIKSMIHNSIWTINDDIVEEILGMVGFVEYIEPGYREKIEMYIFNIINEKECKYYLDIVEGFNSSKLTFGKFNMEHRYANELCLSARKEEVFEVIEDLVHKRIDFLKEKNIEVKTEEYYRSKIKYH